jgi:putative ABC transport system permease protein
MGSLTGLAVRLLRESRGRTVLAGLGVALGVAMFTSSLLLLQSVLAAFDNVHQPSTLTVRPAVGELRQAGRPADVTASLAPQTVEQVRALPGVAAVERRVVGSTSVVGSRTPASKPGQRGEITAIFGLDRSASAQLRIDRGRPFLTGRPEAVLLDRFAVEVGVRPGQYVLVSTPEGSRTLSVVGITTGRPADGSPASGGEIYTSLDEAQRLTGLGNRVSALEVTLAPGTVRARWLSEHYRTLGPGVRITAADEGLDTWRASQAFYTGSLAALGFALLLLGVYLAYVTLSSDVAQRTRLYGTLQALGATRKQVRRLVLAEAAVLGGLSSLAGVVAGVGMAAGLVAVWADQLRPLQVPLQVSPVSIAIGLLVGMVLTTVVGWLPARRAARMDVIEAIVDVETQHGDRKPRRWSTAAGVAVLLAALSGRFGRLGGVLSLVAVGLLMPILLPPLVRLAGRAAVRLSPRMGALAVEHVLADARRSARTATLLSIVLALGLMTGIVYDSLLGTFHDQIRAEMGDDDLRLIGLTAFDPAFLAAVGRSPDVVAVDARTGVSTRLVGSGRAENVRMTGVDPSTHFEGHSYLWADGSNERVRSALQRPNTVMVPLALARQFGVGVGGQVAVQTQQGVHAFAVVATYKSLWDGDRLVTSIRSTQTTFGIDRPVELGLRLRAGADPDRVATDLQMRLGDRIAFTTTDRGEALGAATSSVRNLVTPFLAVTVLQGIVAAVGLADAMVLGVLRRRRELAVVRAIGASRRHVRSLIRTETGTLAFAATLLAVPLGIVVAWQFGSAASSGSDAAQGATLDIHYPWPYFPLLVVPAALIALWPAARAGRQAARIDVEAALRTE